MKKRLYDSSSSVGNPLRWMNANGYDIFLGCSSRNHIDLSWINHRVAPQLQLVFYCALNLIFENFHQLLLNNTLMHIVKSNIMIFWWLLNFKSQNRNRWEYSCLRFLIMKRCSLLKLGFQTSDYVYFFV